MEKQTLNDGLIDYLGRSPTPFHAVANMATILTDNGFTALNEGEDWQLSPGKYFVTRNGSSIIAFVVGKRDTVDGGIRMVGAHTDSPCLKVKPRPEMLVQGYLQLGVEVYGGVLLNPWFDRDLSLAGRLTCLDGEKIRNILIDYRRPIATVPSLAIHLDREANNHRSINAQKDIPPILLQSEKKESLVELLMEQLRHEHPDADIAEILDYELCLYDTNPPVVNGLNGEFIASARLDNLLSCYVGMTALLEADPEVSSLLVCNDHEEVGSASASGAQGPFLHSVLDRILPEKADYYRAITNSLLISTDNAHGIHPNYADRHDANHGPLLNKGPVIKVNANQRYASNSETAAYFKWLCRQHDIPFQVFVNRTDMACGSTIGPLTATEIGVRTLDVGVPTFAMHSIRELGGADDAHHLYCAISGFFRDRQTPGAVSP